MNSTVGPTMTLTSFRPEGPAKTLGSLLDGVP